MEKNSKSKSAKEYYIHAVGRRREAVARVRLYPDAKDVSWGEQQIKKGEIFVNGKPITEYFSGHVAKTIYQKPFQAIGGEGKFIVTVVVSGGGKNGQLAAVVHGIARALSLHDKEKFRPLLKKKGLLTRDSRAKERRKVGTGGKARRKKQSPKR